MNNNFINNVIKGDSIKTMQKISDKSIDLILCDLPYGHTQNNWDSVIPLPKLWKEYNRIIKDNGAILLTSSGMFTAELMMSNPNMYKYKIIWEKSKATNFLNAKKQPLRKYEEICVFYKKQPTYNPQMSEGNPYNKGTRKNQLTGSYGLFSPSEVKSEGTRYPIDLIYFKTAESEGKVYHPTQKPIDLGRYLVKTYSNLGDTILDNTCGSGSFLVSALLEGRNFIGIDKDIDSNRFKDDNVSYVEISKQRIKSAFNNIDVNSEEYLNLKKINLLGDV
ncbi:MULTISPECIES: DNA-methyltransferase [Staphylococcaceae]|uniref:DNA-methyltransferase n=3 Tax=Bacillales TaxID=1385 RepID=UPI000E68B876|nr:MULTISPECIES: site-specific DNA-methyltransferase [Staphylococcaceae]MDW4090029.1 site-specific DNA-methyltransferase [Staphylococcus saprophyticus]MDW4278334.1 site-specific DNA-methyltransferase [Staphylococcus saprophyticus]MEB7998547.1 site-specific DNA-methyltransferase [Staphylococcus saprophyticus]QKQ01968.1 site-specific DNA-methyltransferase [Staphylococcus saprophyticus]RIN17568.1 site-specific DNA-methyltransferase [Mammaliicoccus vitulinus]